MFVPKYMDFTKVICQNNGKSGVEIENEKLKVVIGTITSEIADLVKSSVDQFKSFGTKENIENFLAKLAALKKLGDIPSQQKFDSRNLITIQSQLANQCGITDKIIFEAIERVAKEQGNLTNILQKIRQGVAGLQEDKKAFGHRQKVVHSEIEKVVTCSSRQFENLMSISVQCEESIQKNINEMMKIVDKIKGDRAKVEERLRLADEREELLNEREQLIAKLRVEVEKLVRNDVLVAQEDDIETRLGILQIEKYLDEGDKTLINAQRLLQASKAKGIRFIEKRQKQQQCVSTILYAPPGKEFEVVASKPGNTEHEALIAALHETCRRFIKSPVSRANSVIMNRSVASVAGDY